MLLNIDIFIQIYLDRKDLSFIANTTNIIIAYSTNNNRENIKIKLNLNHLFIYVQKIIDVS